MQYRVLTVNRSSEAGEQNCATIAENLGWKLLDKDIIDAIAYAAHGMRMWCAATMSTWNHGCAASNQQAMRSAALAAGLELRDNAVFDAQEMVKISQNVIEQAYAEGNCVIVGRGSQCVLQHKPDAYHVFVYAPHRQRILRLRERLAQGVDVEERIRTVDGQRAKYLQEYWEKYWLNPHLYDLMISSHEGEDSTARIIQCAMTS